MPVLKNIRHEKFAIAMAQGSTAIDAYTIAGYSPDRGGACNLSAKPSVRARIEELREAAASEAVLTLAEAQQFLSRVVKTPIGKVDEMSELAQEVRYDETGRTIKMPRKLEAITQLAKINGWYAPEKSESTINLPTGIEEALARRFRK